MRALKDIIANPRKPVSPDPAGDYFYIVPWVQGTNGLSCPFSLDTKHGQLLFVFHSQDELYDAFFKSSFEALKPGFRLETAAICVPLEERLGPELAAKMPSGRSFRIVVQGTDEFTELMKELAADTIWRRGDSFSANMVGLQ